MSTQSDPFHPRMQPAHRIYTLLSRRLAARSPEDVAGADARRDAVIEAVMDVARYYDVNLIREQAEQIDTFSLGHTDYIAQLTHGIVRHIREIT